MTMVATPRPADGSGLDVVHSVATVPYAAGMRFDRVPLVEGPPTMSGRLDVPFDSRLPVLTVRLKRSLGDRAVVVRGRVGNTFLRPVVFAPFTLAGSVLPIHRPDLPDEADDAGPFGVNVSVFVVAGAEAHVVDPDVGPANGRLDHADATEWIEGTVVQGRLAALLLLGTLEKQRLIRTGRQVAAARHLELARFAALDERGRSVGVPRRADIDETDEHYRARLATYAQWCLPTPAGWQRALNGPGAPGDPNAGLPSRVGVVDRFRIVEDTNPISISTKLVTVGAQGPQTLVRLHEHLRSALLFDIRGDDGPFRPASQAARLDATRAALQRMQVDGPADECRYLSRLAAGALARVVRVLGVLGVDMPLRLRRAYAPQGGGRYELGLGAEIRPLTVATLRAAARAVADLDDQAPGDRDEIGQLARSLEPRDTADDPMGRWLFEGCGMRTVHQVSATALYVSPLPMYGQWIDGDSLVAPGQRVTYEARSHPSDLLTGIHVRAAAAADAAPAEFAANGLDLPPERLGPADLRERLVLFDGLQGEAPPAFLDTAIGNGVVAADGPGLAAYLLKVINLDQVVGYAIPRAEVEAWGGPAAIRDQLVRWADALREAGFYTVRAVWFAGTGELLVLASISQIPGSDPNLGVRPPSTYYWYAAELPTRTEDMPPPLRLVQPRGGKATAEAIRPGVALVVAIGYRRIGLVDPYEVRIELDDPEAMLTADQYGHLMNVLEAIYPIGIEVNTFDIRRSHVDADGDGVPEFLTSRASRTYHRDRRRRPFDDR